MSNPNKFTKFENLPITIQHTAIICATIVLTTAMLLWFCYQLESNQHELALAKVRTKEVVAPDCRPNPEATSTALKF